MNRNIPALIVHQWLQEWEKVLFDSDHRKGRPMEYFYLFSISAKTLKILSGVYRRSTSNMTPRTHDLGIQRRHDKSRSQEIKDYVRYGYPWSDLNKYRRKSRKYDALRKPGWLPTSIVVNILRPGDNRSGYNIDPSDLISIDEIDKNTAQIKLPTGMNGVGWAPKSIHPIEVIDGQHRLWAFDEDVDLTGDFQLPVVAFHGLDLSWQAYLFWVINIRPKRINASLAFDLYPLLRAEDWLERFEGHSVYRETRAQELVEILWSHPESPWHGRINMLGESGLKVKMVSQAAWIRSLMATYVKAFEGRGVKIGGLFGAPTGQDKSVLPWSRAQQGAFLIHVWTILRDAIKNSTAHWIKRLTDQLNNSDAAFSGPHTLLNTDQGVRAVLYITNDFVYFYSDKLNLQSWRLELEGNIGEQEVTEALQQLRHEKVTRFLKVICAELAEYDWRSSSAPGLSETEKTEKLAFRGSGGYRELRRQLLRHLTKGKFGIIAKTILDYLGYEE